MFKNDKRQEEEPFIVAVDRSDDSRFSCFFAIGAEVSVGPKSAFFQASKRWPDEKLYIFKWVDVPPEIRMSALRADMMTVTTRK
jgi:hypothetical protein